jgi:hypothetical protein
VIASVDVADHPASRAGLQPVSISKQSRVNRILGRTGVRLWGLFALGALLSIGIVALLIVFSVNAQYQQILGQQRALAESIALQTGDYMAKLRNDLRTLTSIVPLSPQSSNGLTRLLYSVQENNPAFMELAIVGPAGTDLARATRADVRNSGLLNRSGSEPFQAALRGEIYTSRVTAPERYAEQTLALPRPRCGRCRDRSDRPDNLVGYRVGCRTWPAWLRLPGR